MASVPASLMHKMLHEVFLGAGAILKDAHNYNGMRPLEVVECRYIKC